jgi:hypothetical protein
MPVAIRSLNGYYGFLDSLRSLEMTTVTEQIPIYRAVSNNIVGGGVLDAPQFPLWGNVFSGRRGRRPLRVQQIKLLEKLGFCGKMWGVLAGFY